MIISKMIRAGVAQAPHHLKWRTKDDMLQFLVVNPSSQGTVIYTVDQNVTFKELKQRELFRQYQFTLPNGVDPSLPVATILAEEERPISVEVEHNGQKYLFKNRMAQADQRCIVKALSNSLGPFKFLEKQSTFGDYRRALTGYYLRLQAEAYIRNKGINLKSELTPSLRQEILMYLGSINQVSQQSSVAQYLQSYQSISIKMAMTQKKIDDLLTHADSLLGIYRLAAIGLSVVHVGGFGYMIFGVQWLGWDIIEPLTFSVGTLYTLLAMRFYRKFQKDRNQQSIRESLRDWVLRSHKKMQLGLLKAKLKQQEGQLKDLQQKIKIKRNRLALQSTLPTDF